MCEAGRRQHLLLAVGIEVEQGHLRLATSPCRAGASRRSGRQTRASSRSTTRGRGVAGGRQVGRPLPAPLGHVDRAGGTRG